MQCPTQLPRVALGVFLAPQQVGASHVADEERAPGEEQGGPLTAGAVRDQEANMLRRMPGGMQDLDDHLSHLQSLPIRQVAHWIAERGTGPRQQLHLSPRRQLAYPGQIIIMLMRIGSIANTHAMLARCRKIHVNVTTDIQDQGFTRLLRANQVRRMPETLQIKLLEDHLWCSPCREGHRY